LTKEEGLRPYI